ncbi:MULTISPECIES: F0F1 ATP synthase subunit B [unclassified Microcella]|uniref:F0F1 ATP synthase subunit B n=1 Tax=unclassified Microcella TaxID=2630066 RepID=UPI0006F79F9F|nr:MULTISPECIES: F0F1 ATP synthase subunit B [unclassified Microcella]KQV24742.1 ATP synthase F0F1 subunit B [Yonghaparkia sp. Root332]KRF31031.1 ATP synthase F0F1 subunit B [Yonghaparkia sp. Soil809]
MLEALIIAAEEGEAVNPLIPAWYDIVYSIIPFLLVLLVFWKVVLPRMQATLDERSAKIEGGIKQAESAQAEAKAALEEYNKLLAEARAEASKIREQARVDGGAILAELKEQASTEAARITATAQQQIEAERQAALVSLRAEVGSLALDLASGVIGESLADDTKATALVDRFLAELESSEKAAK